MFFRQPLNESFIAASGSAPPNITRAGANHTAMMTGR